MPQPDRFRFAARLSTALAAVLAVSSLLLRALHRP
jgi:hypothetical protein